MRLFTSLFVLILATLSSCAQGTAGVTIPANQTFILGEYRAEGYRATMTNKGRRTVVVQLVDQAKGSVVSSLTLKPGTRESLEVGDGQRVHLINDNGGKAKVMVKSNVKGVEGMRYVDNDVDQPTKVKLPAPPAPSAARTERPDDYEGQLSASIRLAPGQTFIVGEGSHKYYMVALKVSGGEVEVTGRDQVTGKRMQGYGLRGKERMSIRPNENLYVKNISSKKVKLSLTFDKPVAGARIK